uniref:Uncharacterized protein n=1 Tax=Streptomyces avermitilis TaxID=33903 RepID=A0A499W768_STRAX|nr:hypothetical protein SAVMC3_86550 [Streptomyces avermitilis]
MVEPFLDLPSLGHRLGLVGQQQGAGQERLTEFGQQGLDDLVVGDADPDRLLLRMQQLAGNLLRGGRMNV